jgi:nucleotide-binding universal stress UspA family protein
MDRKILVAVDGSIYSTHALYYLGHLYENLPGIHFHLLTMVPLTSSSAALEMLDEAELINTLGASARKTLLAQDKYMQHAVEQLVRYGVPAAQISSSVRPARMGISQDILQEARKGRYDALVIGRRGIGKIEELFMGSVSSSILEICHDTPVWIIDGKVNSRKFLVPIDGTFNSLNAVDHLAYMLASNPGAEVTLFHSAALLAGKTTADPKEFHEKWGKEWCDQHLDRPDSLFHAPRQLLVESGFPENNIFWLETFKGIDPSRQILRQALIDDFGTIVIGRRGSEVEKGVFKRVSDRILYMAEEVAVWIVG